LIARAYALARSPGVLSVLMCPYIMA
jgi:hypothetical protein